MPRLFEYNDGGKVPKVPEDASQLQHTQLTADDIVLLEPVVTQNLNTDRNPGFPTDRAEANFTRATLQDGSTVWLEGETHEIGKLAEDMEEKGAVAVEVFEESVLEPSYAIVDPDYVEEVQEHPDRTQPSFLELKNETSLAVSDKGVSQFREGKQNLELKRAAGKLGEASVSVDKTPGISPPRAGAKPKGAGGPNL